jgi:hypothetical protein
MVAKVIERVQAHYEVRDVEMGKVYRWRLESVVVECECGKNPILIASETTCKRVRDRSSGYRRRSSVRSAP